MAIEALGIVVEQRPDVGSRRTARAQTELGIEEVAVVEYEAPEPPDQHKQNRRPPCRIEQDFDVAGQVGQQQEDDAADQDAHEKAPHRAGASCREAPQRPGSCKGRRCMPTPPV
jgi:hypothetical protein